MEASGLQIFLTLGGLERNDDGESKAGSRTEVVDEFEGQQFDYVFTVCDNAKEARPIFSVAGDGSIRASEDLAVPPTDTNSKSSVDTRSDC